jgi:hypothetical protein
MKTDKYHLSTVLTGLLVMALMSLALPGPAAGRSDQPAGVPPTQDLYLCQIESPNAGVVNTLNAVSAAPISAIDSKTVWAVGYTENLKIFPAKIKTLTMRYDGKFWSVVPSPNVASENYLNAVATSAYNNAWAVGYALDSSGLERPLIMRFTGASWKVVELPGDPMSPAPLSARLNGVTAFGEGQVMAVGHYAYGMSAPQPLALYFDGKSWTKMYIPSGDESVKLYGVTAGGPKNIWAVGTTGSDNNDVAAALLYHYDGTSWTAKTKGAGYLTSVAISDAGIFTVGDVTGKSGKETLAMLYNPGTGDFDRIASFNLDVDHNYLTSVVSDGHQVYAVGYAGDPASDFETAPLALRYDGKTFVQMSAPHSSSVDKLAAATISNGGLWAVGTSSNGGLGTRTLILTSQCSNGFLDR